MALLPLTRTVADLEAPHLADHLQIHTKLNHVLDAVADFGADPTGAADSTTALQNWINASIEAGDPTTTGLLATAQLFLPAGTYKVTAPLVIRGVAGVNMFGAGKRLTRFAPFAAMDSVLDLDGVTYSTFRDFSIKANGTNLIDKCIELHWGTGTYQNATSNRFDNIFIADTTFRTGFGIGTDNSNQVDHTVFVNCHVRGQWPTSGASTTQWQYGWEIGNGSAGNNLGHHFYGCEGYGNRKNIAYLGSHGTINGGFLQGSEADLYVGTPNGPIVMVGVRSEDSQRLVDVAGATQSALNLSIRDCEYHGGDINADGYFIRYKAGGVLLIENVRARAPATGVTMRVQNDAYGRTVILGYSSPTAVTDILRGAGDFFIAGVTQVASNGSTTNFLAGPSVMGTMSFGGTPNGGAADVSLSRLVANVLAMGANDCFVTGKDVTGSRPNAATVGEGAQFYDTTLDKPIWSDGTNWQDGFGPLQAWVAPTLTNSWVNYGGSEETAGYWKDPFGIVHLKGTVKSGTLGAAIFTLPVGYRPFANQFFPAWSDGAFGGISISSAGVVATEGGTNISMSLAGITFRQEA